MSMACIDILSPAAWREFGPGPWQPEINVRGFIQSSYAPYAGNEFFLPGWSADERG